MFGSMGQTNVKNLGNGGTMDGDVTITGDLTVSGGIGLTLSEVIQGTSTIDVTNTEALLVRKDGDGGDVFIVDTTNSRVGIGVTPTSVLHLKQANDGATTEIAIDNSASGGSTDELVGIRFRHNGGTSAGILSGRDEDFSSSANRSGNLIFRTNKDDSYSEKMRLTSGGLLGLGISSPQKLLHLDSSSGFAEMRLSGTSGGGTVEFYNDSTALGDIFFDTSKRFHVRTNGATTALTIDENQNIGIGNAGTFDNPNSASKVLEIATASPVGLILNDTRDANPITLENRGAVFHLAHGTTSRLVVNDSGNVGIMEDSPDKELHLKGNEPTFRIEQTADANKYFDIQTGTGGGVGKLKFSSESQSNTLVIGNNARVGVNNGAPAYTLHVKSDDGLFLERDAGTFGLQVYADGSGSYLKASANDLQFWTGSTPTEKARITQAGNVGIGATTIQQLLHLEKDDADVGIALTQSGQRSWSFGIDNSDSDRLKIGYSTTIGTNTVATFTEAGQLGIGGTPSNQLTVVGDNAIKNISIYTNSDSAVTTDTGARIFTTGDGGSGIYGENGHLVIQGRPAGRGIIFLSGSSATERMRIDSSGHVGIGVAPDGILFRAEKEVNGNWAGLIKNTHATNGYGLKVQGGDDANVVSFTVRDVSNNSLLEVLGNGNVGIGGSPDRTLHLIDDSRVDIKFTRTGSSDHYIRKDGHFLRFRGHDDSTILLELQNNSQNNIVAFPSGGNVGIGLDTPTQDLEIKMDTDKHMLFSDSQGETGNCPTIHTTNTAGSALVDLGFRADNILFATGSAERMRLTDSGLSVGTTATYGNLTVGGTGELIAGRASSGAGSFSMYEAGTTRFVIESLNGSGGLAFKTPSTARMIIDDNSRISLSNNDAGADSSTQNGLDSTSGNTLFGYLAGGTIDLNTINNTFVGHKAGSGSKSDAQNNTAFGANSLASLTSGDNNTAVGYNSLDAGTDAHDNTAIGFASLGSSTSVGYAVAIGNEAINNGNVTADADGAIGIGYKALYSLTSGAKNVAIGYKAGETYNGSNSVIIGYEAGLNMDTSGITASNSVLIGVEAGKELDDGSFNVAIGEEAMKSNSGGGNTAIRNVCIGYRAGTLLRTGSDNVVIGHGASISATNAVNQIAIGKEVIGVADNSVTLGNADVTDVYMAQDARAKMRSGQINVTADSSTNAVTAFIRTENNSDYSASVLNVQGDRTTTNNTYNLANFTNAGTPKCVITDGGDLKNANNSYGAISDKKLKQDISDASSQWDDIKAVRFRKFKFKDMVEEGFKLGVVAQELEKVSPKLISEAIDRDVDGKDLGTTTKSVKYSILQMKGLVALQEAMKRIEELEAKVAELEKK